MKYLSIDLETTALKPKKGQIIEIGAVYDDTDHPLEHAQTFERLVFPSFGSVLRGEPFALAMNVEILKEMSLNWDNDPLPWNCVRVEYLPEVFSRWLAQVANLPHGERIVVTGKNYGMFDNGWLEAIDFDIKNHHRVIDPGNLYWLPSVDGAVLPGTDECLRRAGLDGKTKHRALGDAKNVCRLIRHHVEKCGSLR